MFQEEVGLHHTLAFTQETHKNTHTQTHTRVHTHAQSNGSHRLCRQQNGIQRSNDSCSDKKGHIHHTLLNLDQTQTPTYETTTCYIE